MPGLDSETFANGKNGKNNNRKYAVILQTEMFNHLQFFSIAW